MSTCIKELYDYDLVKKCSRCGIVNLKSKFLKRLKSSDGLFAQCKCCVIEKQRIYDSEKREKIINRKIIDQNIMINLWLRKKHILITDIKQISIIV